MTKFSLSPYLLVASSLLLAACSYTNPLDLRYDLDRSQFTTTPLPNPGPDAPKVEIVNPDPVKEPTTVFVETIITGTWTFTTPATTTTVERKAANFHQYSIYQGRPAPTDTPFVVITVSSDARTIAEAEPQTYKVSNNRSYVLNGNIAKEWTGRTNTGSSFNELIIRKPGDSKSDLCHAMAIAKNEEERKASIEILGSIVWKANPSGPQPKSSSDVLPAQRDVLAATGWAFQRQPDGTYKCVQVAGE